MVPFMNWRTLGRDRRVQEEDNQLSLDTFSLSHQGCVRPLIVWHQPPSPTCFCTHSSPPCHAYLYCLVTLSFLLSTSILYVFASADASAENAFPLPSQPSECLVITQLQSLVFSESFQILPRSTPFCGCPSMLKDLCLALNTSSHRSLFICPLFLPGNSFIENRNCHQCSFMLKVGRYFI